MVVSLLLSIAAVLPITSAQGTVGEWWQPPNDMMSIKVLSYSGTCQNPVVSHPEYELLYVHAEWSGNYTYGGQEYYAEASASFDLLNSYVDEHGLIRVKYQLDLARNPASTVQVKISVGSETLVDEKLMGAWPGFSSSRSGSIPYVPNATYTLEIVIWAVPEASCGNVYRTLFELCHYTVRFVLSAVQRDPEQGIPRMRIDGIMRYRASYGPDNPIGFEFSAPGAEEYLIKNFTATASSLHLLPSIIKLTNDDMESGNVCPGYTDIAWMRVFTNTWWGWGNWTIAEWAEEPSLSCSGGKPVVHGVAEVKPAFFPNPGGETVALPVGLVYRVALNTPSLDTAEYKTINFEYSVIPDTEILKTNPWATGGGAPTITADMAYTTVAGVAAGALAKALSKLAASPTLRNAFKKLLQKVGKWGEFEDIIEDGSKISSMKISVKGPKDEALKLIQKIQERARLIARERGTLTQAERQWLERQMNDLMRLARKYENVENIPPDVKEVIEGAITQIREKLYQDEIEGMVRTVNRLKEAVESELRNAKSKGLIEDFVVTYDSATVELSLQSLAGFGTGLVTAVPVGLAAVATATGVTYFVDIIMPEPQKGTGIHYAQATVFVVKDASGKKRVVIQGFAPDEEYGMVGICIGGWCLGKRLTTASEILREFVEGYIYGESQVDFQKNPNTIEDIQVLTPPKRPGTSASTYVTEIVEKTSAYWKEDLASYLRKKVGSDVTIEGVYIVSLYIPYATVNIVDALLNKAHHVADLTINEDPQIIRMWAVTKDEVITDPDRMIEILGSAKVQAILPDGSVVTKTLSWHKGSSGAPELSALFAYNPQGGIGVIAYNVTPVSRVYEYVADVKVLTGLWVKAIGDPVNNTIKFRFEFPCTEVSAFFMERGVVELLGLPQKPKKPILFTIRSRDEVYPIKIPPDKFYWEYVRDDGWYGKATIQEVPIPVPLRASGCGLTIDVEVPLPGAKDVGVDLYLNGGSHEVPSEARVVVYSTVVPNRATVHVSARIFYRGVYGEFIDLRKKDLGTYSTDTWPRYDPELDALVGIDKRIPIGDLVYEAQRHATLTGFDTFLEVKAEIVQADANSYSGNDEAVRIAKIHGLLNYTIMFHVTVEDPNQNPIPNALVEVFGRVNASGVTNSTGDTVLELVPGFYDIRITAEGYYPFYSSNEYINETTWWVFVLEPMPPGNATLHVYVYDASTSEPIEGASVKLIGNETRSAVTNSTGWADFTDIPTGSYKLRVVKAGYLAHEQAIALDPGEHFVEVALQPMPENVTLQVTVLDANTSEPIQGALVTLRNGTVYREGVTDAEGRIVFHVIPEHYTLYVSKDGYHPYSEKIALYTDMNKTVYLAPVGPGPGPGPGTITIIVRDAKTLNPIPGANVTIWSSTDTYTEFTDESGKAVFTDIYSNLYTIEITKTGYLPVHASTYLLIGVEYEFLMTPESSARPTRLHVYVIDSKSQEPIAGALVMLENSTNLLSEYTNSSGYADFLLQPGTYKIHVEHPNYVPYDSGLYVPPNTEFTYTVSLTESDLCPPPPGSNYTQPSRCGYLWLVPRVFFSNGAPFEGAQVTIKNATTYEVIGNATTDGTGRAYFELPANMSYLVEVYAINPYNESQSVNMTRLVYLNASYEIWFYTPWFHGRPEVAAYWVDIVVTKYGLWNYSHLVIYQLYTNYPQVVALNLSITKVADGSIVASKTFQHNLTETDITTWFTFIQINGSGFEYLRPVLRITDYENDTDSENNVVYGPEVLFKPYIDLVLSAYLTGDPDHTPFLYPEHSDVILVMNVTSNVKLPEWLEAKLVANLTYISSLTKKLEYLYKGNYTIGFYQNLTSQITVKKLVPWTREVVGGVALICEYDDMAINNYASPSQVMAFAVKLAKLHAPKAVSAGSNFTISIEAWSNQNKSQSLMIKIGGELVADIPVYVREGVNEFNLTVTAPVETGEKLLNATIAVDDWMGDNSQTQQITILPSWSNWIIWLVLAAGGIAGVAAVYKVARSRKHYESIARKRRRALEEWGWENA